MPSSQPPRPPEQRRVRVSLGEELARVQATLDRIESLMVIYDSIEDRRDLSDFNQRDDLLRMQVVFLHAMLEDFLRSVGAICLPQAPAAILNTIPLIGAGKLPKELPYTPLGAIAGHRFQSVYEVIDASVQAYLARLTFDDTATIRKYLGRCGLDGTECEPIYPEIEALIKRRHQIVHQTDIPADDDSPAPINRERVIEWLTAARKIAGVISHAHVRKWG